MVLAVTTLGICLKGREYNDVIDSAMIIGEKFVKSGF